MTRFAVLAFVALLLVGGDAQAQGPVFSPTGPDAEERAYEIEPVPDELLPFFTDRTTSRQRFNGRPETVEVLHRRHLGAPG